MNVLMFSTDSSILKPGAPARKRMEKYASALGSLHILVAGEGESSANSNLFVYPVSGPRALQLLRYWRFAASLLRRGRFDVVTVQAPDEVGIVGFFIARRFSIPFQLQIHTDVLSSHYARASLKERVRSWIACFLIKRADCLRVVSARIKKSIERAFPTFPRERIVVLPIQTDARPRAAHESAPTFPNELGGRELKMIAVGRFVEKEKNFLMLIRLMRDVTKAVPTAVLVLVGDGPDRERYRNEIKSLGLSGNVLLQGWRTDLRDYYPHFDLFLLSSNYEGWGRAALEALAAGLPVITTDVGLAGEVIEDGREGYVVPVGDARAFLEKILFIARRPDIRNAYSANARKKAGMHFSSNYLNDYRESYTVCRIQGRSDSILR